MTPGRRATLQRGLVVVGIVVLAFNLRPAAVSVGPVLGEIRSGLGMSSTQAGVLTSLPVLAFAVFGALAPRLARHIGLHRLTMLALLCVENTPLRRVTRTIVFVPVVIALGGDPASIYSGSAPLPPNIDEFIFAGFLRRAPVELAKAVTCDLDVPAEAELVIEGYIDPGEELVLEGPFGDHTGFYSLADYYPKVHVTAVTMRRSPIYPATLVGKPPMEDYYLGHATERIFLPLLRLTVPEIVDYHMPAAGIFHNLVFVSIDKQYPGQAYKVMNALWGQGLMSLAKVLVVVDREIDVRNPDEAWWAALNNIDPERDVRFTMGPVDVLDHASRAFTYGSKMGIDGTRKWPEEGFTREWPDVIEMDPETKARVDELWPTLGIRL